MVCVCTIIPYLCFRNARWYVMSKMMPGGMMDDWDNIQKSITKMKVASLSLSLSCNVLSLASNEVTSHLIPDCATWRQEHWAVHLSTYLHVGLKVQSSNKKKSINKLHTRKSNILSVHTQIRKSNVLRTNKIIIPSTLYMEIQVITLSRV